MEVELEHAAYHAINQFAALVERQTAQSKKSNLIQMDAVRKHLGRLKELQVQVEQLKASKCVALCQSAGNVHCILGNPLCRQL